MDKTIELRLHLQHLVAALKESGDMEHWGQVQRALDGSDEAVEAFLISNELWGGAGSIADQAGVDRGRDVRRSIEAALTRLGEAQISFRLVNPRTELWTGAFRQLQSKGI